MAKLEMKYVWWLFQWSIFQLLRHETGILFTEDTNFDVQKYPNQNLQILENKNDKTPSRIAKRMAPPCPPDRMKPIV